MMNRRQFLSAAAAGAAMFVRAPKAFAARYDMIIRGGRVIDPSVRLDAIRDVAISGGRIVAVGIGRQQAGEEHLTTPFQLNERGD